MLHFNLLPDYYKVKKAKMCISYCKIQKANSNLEKNVSCKMVITLKSLQVTVRVRLCRNRLIGMRESTEHSTSQFKCKICTRIGIYDKQIKPNSCGILIQYFISNCHFPSITVNISCL